VSKPFSVAVCTACDHALWPPRPVCPRCASTVFGERVADSGILEETTRSQDTLLASVRTLAGPTVIARLRRGAPRGAEVALTRDESPAGDSVIVIASPRQ